MADLNTTNQAATIGDKVIHALIFDVAVKAAEAEIVAAVPIMGAPFLKQIDEQVLGFVAQKIYEKISLCATFTIIDAQTSAEAAAANAAANELKAELQKGTPSEIAQATEAFKSSFGKLARFDGSASP